MPGFELVGEEEREAVNDIFDEKSLFYNGKRVREFEKQFANYMGVKYAVAVSSGTAAIKTALVAAGIGPGDEVITQAFTFVATVEAIVDVGARPVIVNIDDTLNMDPHQLERAITEKTKAIMPVHMLGVAAEVDQILSVAKENNIMVIDDGCEALGAEWGNEKLGAQTDVCTWSFDVGKTITAGEGGMITTNEEDIYKLSLEYRDHGHENNPNYPRGRDTHRIYGFNFRTTELNAAIGLAQLKKLDFIVESNRKHFSIYQNALSDVHGITFRRIPEKCNPLCDCLIFNFPKTEKAKNFVKLIGERGLGTKNVPDAVEWHFARHWDHIFKQYDMNASDLEEMTKPSAAILDRSVALPVMVNMDPEKVIKNAEIYRDVAKKVLSI